MAKIGFVSENKSKSGSGYNKLSLEYGEMVRICLIEPQPTFLYVHTLNMPEIDTDGSVVKETRQGKRGDYEVVSMDFAGQHACLGDAEVVANKETDPAGCISCKFAAEHPDMFQPPRRRFAQHVLKYSTQPGKFAVRTPFQAELIAWVYADNRFNSIVDFVEEHGNPREFDLLLGPCENKKFQKFDMKLGSKPAAWMADKERMALVAEIYKNNQHDDLEGLIARKLSSAQMRLDIDKVLDRYAQINGAGSAAAAAGGSTEDSITSVEDLLGGVAEPVKKAEPAAAPEPEATAPEAEVETTDSAGADPEPPAKPAAKPAEDEDDTEIDFEKMLAGL